MTYYDRLAENPDQVLRAVAQRRNLSLEELRERIAEIHAAAHSGEHLTLGQAMLVLEQPGSAPELEAHLNSCRYCQAMADGLSPARLSEGAQRLNEEVRRVPVRPLPERAAAAARGFAESHWAELGLLAAGFVAAFFVIPNALVPHTLAPRMANVNLTDFNDLKGENARLRAAVLKTEQENSPESLITASGSATESNGESVIAGTVLSSCALVKPSDKVPTVFCVTPSKTRKLYLTVNGGDADGRGATLARSASTVEEAKPEGVAYFEHPFFSRDALRAGDPVFVYQATATQHDSVKAVEASLAALVDSVKSADTSTSMTGGTSTTATTPSPRPVK